MSPGPGDDERRPSAEAPLTKSNLTDTPSLGAIAAACTAYAVVVITEEPEGELRFSRRLFLSLHSAEKSVRRAERRGRRASMVLCQLTPVQVDLLGSEVVL